ncbi:MAG: MFS transporter [Sphingomonas fennica]
MERSSTAGEARTPSTFSALGHVGYRTLWLASLAVNLGNAVQGVGAAWALTAGGAPADIVALVQTAVSLPVMLLALVGGAFADMHDRRRVMLTTLAAMAGAAALLAGLEGSGQLSAWPLLALTFALGASVAFYNPCVQATIGEVVPREELGGAVSLNILGFNVARAAGPALGGAIVAAGGALSAFLFNTGAYAVAIAILLLAPRLPAAPRGPRRPIGAVIGEGLAHAVRDAAIRAILLRGAAFTVAGGAAWALMPLVARDLTGGGPRALGLLLGALGLGAVIGAAISHRVRRRLGPGAILRVACLVYGIACIVVALRPGLALSMAALVVGGAGWVQALSGFSVSGQLLSPRPLIGRVSATINTVVFGGLALGAWLWGHVAEGHGVAVAIGGSGAAMLVLALLPARR